VVPSPAAFATSCRFNAHQLRGFIDLGAAVAVAAQGVGGEHLHAVGLEDQQRGIVQGTDLVVGKDPQRLEGIFKLPVGRGASRNRLAFSAVGLRRRFGRRAARISRSVMPELLQSEEGGGGEALDEPGAEQRDGRIAERLGIGHQVIAEAVVERGIERRHQPALLQVGTKQIQVHQRQPLTAQGLLDGEQFGVEHQTAFDMHRTQVGLPLELNPEVVPRHIIDAHVNQLIGADERAQVISRMTRRHVGMATPGPLRDRPE